MDAGSAMKAEQGAAGATRVNQNDWLSCWATVEALARHADALVEKCGGNCTLDDLVDWRERIMVQLRAALADEERIFGELQRQTTSSGHPEHLQSMSSGA